MHSRKQASALRRLPLLREEFRTGKRHSSVVREITRVAVPETEKEWLEATGRDSPGRRVLAAVRSRCAPGTTVEDLLRAALREAMAQSRTARRAAS